MFKEEPKVVAINGSKLQYDVFDPNDHASLPGQNIEFSGSVMASQPDEDMSVCDASHSEMLSNSYSNVMFGDEMEFVQMDVLDDDNPSGHDVDFENRLVGVISLLLQSESSPRDNGTILFSRLPGQNIEFGGSVVVGHECI
jgi:hypothetical protein